MTKVLLPLGDEMIMLGQVMIHKEKLNFTSTSHYTQTLILEKNIEEFFITFRETNFSSMGHKTQK